ncbi:MAG: hypothetical protein ABII71_04660 [Candidatus Micrarchaeota archaeon]
MRKLTISGRLLKEAIAEQQLENGRIIVRARRLPLLKAGYDVLFEDGPRRARAEGDFLSVMQWVRKHRLDDVGDLVWMAGTALKDVRHHSDSWFSKNEMLVLSALVHNELTVKGLAMVTGLSPRAAEKALGSLIECDTAEEGRKTSTGRGVFRLTEDGREFTDRFLTDAGFFSMQERMKDRY